MTRTIDDARKIGESRIGRQLEEDEFQKLLSYARHKAECQGNGESYVPYLLPDVISENDFSDRTFALYREYKAGIEELNRMMEKEAERCKLQLELAKRLGLSPETVASVLSAIRVSSGMNLATP